ncbi:MAG: LLM class flavin-dependent oxidoreductase [Chloroflexi bacterium]|nr:LLM class flavin-dependent oxidoreductase [Chloroflexota bacterium]
MPPHVRSAVALSNQDITWPDDRTALLAADEMAFETFWPFDHLMPIGHDPEGSCFECYTTLAAFGEATRRIRIGALVSGAAYRNAALAVGLRSG